MSDNPSSTATWTQRVVEHLGQDVDAPAIISVMPDRVESWTRSEFAAMTCGAIELLDASGVGDGEFVPALLSTRPMSVALLLAGALTNRPLVPLAPRLTRRELFACVEHVNGDVLLTEPDYLDMATDLAAATGKRVHVVAEPAFATGALRARSDPNAVALVMHTSGTTGLPKQVWAREAQLARRAEVNGSALRLEVHSRLAIAAVFHHVAAIGNIAVGLANGSALVLFPAFSVSAWRGLEPVAPTHTVLVPSIIETLLNADAFALPSLEVLAYGGSPIHPNTMRRVQAVTPTADFVHLFGQTEGSPLAVLSAADHRDAAAGREELLKSVGRAAPGVELRIDDPDPEGVGEVWARGGHSFVVDDDGWQHTGDLGYLADDYLYLVGRRGDKIIRGGENVFPLEVEQVLETHPEVLEAAVVGVPDARLGETIAGFVVPVHPDAPPNTEELRAYCRERLAGFKVPVVWTFTDALPRNPNGKLVRRELIRPAAGISQVE
ncbi:MAG: fatty acid--CoA ligase family protein [Mycobacterium sp.]